MKTLLILTGILFLIGCNSNEKYAGKYYLYKIDTVIVKDTNVYFLLKPDNTLTFYSDKDTINGHWEAKEIESDGYTGFSMGFNKSASYGLLYADKDSKENSFKIEKFEQFNTKNKYSKAKNVVFTHIPLKTQAK